MIDCSEGDSTHLAAADEALMMFSGWDGVQAFGEDALYAWQW